MRITSAEDLASARRCIRDDVQLLLCAEPQVHIPSNLHSFVFRDKSCEELLIHHANADYGIIVYPGAVLGADFVDDALRIVKSHGQENILTLRYLEGFYKTSTRRSFVQEVNPLTVKRMRLASVLEGPHYFVPGICFIWPLEIIRQYGVTFNDEILNYALRHAIFGVEVLSSMFVASGYVAPEVFRRSANFVVPVIENNPAQSQLYFDTIQSKRAIWHKNLWSEVAFVSRSRRISSLTSKVLRAGRESAKSAIKNLNK